MLDVFMARQPIYDKSLHVIAYELLFRRGRANEAGHLCEKDAAQAIVNSLIELGLDRLVGARTAFINLNRELLLSPHIRTLPRDKVVFEIVEDVLPDEETISAMRSLHQAGYVIALDDFIMSESVKPFLPYSLIIKIDVLLLNRAEIAEHLRLLRRNGVKLLAEKVENRAMFEYCKKLNFDYFQGFFFCKPEIVQGKSLPVNKLAILRLLSRLQDPKIGLAELEQIVSQDVYLSYKLLRLINSAYAAMNKHVDSLRQALLLLGTQTVTGFASLVLMAGMAGKPPELTNVAMVRAKLCELIARKLHKPEADKYFTTGLFSVLDAAMDLPMEEALRRLPLAADVKSALMGLSQEDELSVVLRWVIAYERGEFEGILLAPALADFMSEAYAEAVEWSRALLPALAA